MATDAQLEAQFREFHRLNPDVYSTLVDLARKAKSRGKTKIGIKMLWEVLRWERFLATVGDSDYKLNNNYHSRYARLIMEQEGDLAGIFEVRKLKTPQDTSDTSEEMDFLNWEV
jgi:hypothetical protein